MAQAKKQSKVTIDEVEATVNGKKVMVPSDAQMRKDGMSTLSSRIRHLASMGIATGPISRIVKRENGEHPIYQHVRNVLNTPLKGDA
jgi:hypothetical protein